MIFLYIGAGTDIWPIIRYAITHRTFIYIDSLPSKDYFPNRSVQDMAQLISKRLVAAGADIRSSELKGNKLLLVTSTQLELEYWFNTTLEDAWEIPELAECLDMVDTLYISEFVPTLRLADLPALETVMYTLNTAPDALTFLESSGDIDRYRLILPQSYMDTSDGTILLNHEEDHCLGCDDKNMCENIGLLIANDI